MELLLTQNNKNNRWTLYDRSDHKPARLDDRQRQQIIKKLSSKCIDCPLNNKIDCSTMSSINTRSELVNCNGQTVSVEFCPAVGPLTV